MPLCGSDVFLYGGAVDLAMVMWPDLMPSAMIPTGSTPSELTYLRFSAFLIRVRCGAQVYLGGCRKVCSQ